MRFLFILLFIGVFLSTSLYMLVHKKDDVIYVGLLYSKTGVMSVEEQVIAQMVRFGIEELNQQGGIHHKKIKVIEYDGASDPQSFAKGAEFLIGKGVQVIFGCWTSASRVAVKPIVEQHQVTLIYPVQFEGFETSKNIIYLGAVPNQQINPTLNYVKERYGDRIYVVGSDYIYPRVANIYIHELAKIISMNVVGSYFAPLEATDFSAAIADIQKLQPNAIINLINGASNLAFFEQLYAAQLGARDYPSFSMSIDESSIKQISKTIGIEKIKDHYFVNSYISSINSQENRLLLSRLTREFGDDFVLTDAGYFSYLGVHLWKNAYQRAKIHDISLQDAIGSQSIASALGVIYIDPDTNYAYKRMHIARISEQEHDIVWRSNKIIKPVAFSNFHSKESWLDMINQVLSPTSLQDK